MITYVNTTVNYTANIAYTFTQYNYSSSSTSYNNVRTDIPANNFFQSSYQEIFQETRELLSNGASLYTSFYSTYMSDSVSASQASYTTTDGASTNTITVPSSSFSESVTQFSTKSVLSTNDPTSASYLSSSSHSFHAENSTTNINLTFFTTESNSNDNTLEFTIITSLNKTTIDSNNSEFIPFNSTVSVQLTKTSTLSVIGLNTYFTSEITYLNTNTDINPGTSYTTYKELTKIINAPFKFLNKYYMNGENDIIWLPANVSSTNLTPFNSDFFYSFTEDTITPTFFSLTLASPGAKSTTTITQSFTNNTFLFREDTSLQKSYKENLLSPIFLSNDETYYYSVNSELQTISFTSSYNILINNYISLLKTVDSIVFSYNEHTSFTFHLSSFLPTVIKSQQKTSWVDGPPPTTTESIFSGAETVYISREAGYNSPITSYIVGIPQIGTNSQNTPLQIYSKYIDGFALPLSVSDSTTQNIGSNIILNNTNVTINPYGIFGEKGGVNVPLPATYSDILSIDSNGVSLSPESWTTITVNIDYNSISITYDGANFSSIQTYTQILSLDGNLSDITSTITTNVIGGVNYKDNSLLYQNNYYLYTIYDMISSSTSSTFINQENNQSFENLSSNQNLSVYENMSYGYVTLSPFILSIITEQRNNSNAPVLDYFWQSQTNTDI